MKVIKTLEEYCDAGVVGRLEYCQSANESGTTWSSPVNWQSNDILDVREDIELGLYRWSPETVELVEWKKLTRFAVEHSSGMRILRAEGDDPTQGYWQKTGRTGTLTINEVENDE